MKTTKNKPAKRDGIRATTAALQALYDKMEFVQPLPPEQRKTIARLGPKTVALTTKRLAAAQQHPEALPAAFDLRQFARQTALLVAVDECHTVLQSMLQDVHDTLLVLGQRAVESSKSAFRSEERRVGKECRSRWSQ